MEKRVNAILIFLVVALFVIATIAYILWKFDSNVSDTVNLNVFYIVRSMVIIK